MRRYFLYSFIIFFGVILFFSPVLKTSQAQAACDPDALTTRVSVASDGTQGNEFSGGVPYLSGDGRYVAYWSVADNLVPNDTNERADAFVYDRQTCTTHRVSVSSTGIQSDDTSYTGPLSADGRYAVFESGGSNLVANDISCGFSSQGGECFDIFVHDLQTGQTVRVSVASDGTPANEGSYNPQMSPDGRYILFDSPANNLVSGDTNNTNDVFVHDRDADNDDIFDEAGAIETIRVSIAPDGTEGNAYSMGGSISADRRYVAFRSRATNLVSGTYAACFIGTTPSTCNEIFVRDMQDGSLTRVSIGLNDTPLNDDVRGASISADGRYVIFDTYASNLVSGDTNNHLDVFIHDLEMGQTERISVGYDGSQTSANSSGPVISMDSRYVAFHSSANNLIETGISASPQVFVRDLATGENLLVSRNVDNIESNNGSGGPSISFDGAMIAFISNSSNLVPGDNGLYQDIFAVHREIVPPSQPAAPTLTAPADNAISSNPRPEFSWNAVVDATSYEMQLDTNNPPTANVFSGSNTSYTPASDLANGVYYWRVRTLQDSEFSEWSDIRTLTIDTVPAIPTLIAPTDGTSTTNTKPTFSWNAVTDAVSYEIQIGRDNPPNTPIIDVSETTYTPPDDLLTTTYYWRVRAKDADGDVSEWSTIFDVTLESLSNARPLRNLFATGTPTLTWNRIIGATGYRVQVARDSKFTGIVYENPNIPSGTLEVTVTPALSDGVYYWRVRALKSNGAGNWSASQSFMVDAP